MMMKLIARQMIILMGVVVTMSACETRPAKQDVIEEMKTVIDESITADDRPTEPPDSVRRSLIPTINLDASQVPHVEDQQRFDISVNNVPADQFFLSLVDGTAYNMRSEERRVG